MYVSGKRSTSETKRVARAAKLVFVSRDAPGLSRRRCGRGFCYTTRNGRLVRDTRTLTRIKALAVPPAWTEVWICANARGYLQATGRDARGRTQYRYHGAWREIRDESKFARMPLFAAALPKLRRRVRAALRLHGLPREKVLAAAIRLLDLAGLRIGNEEYRAANGSFGLTTLEDRHCRTCGSQIFIRFPGKSGQRQCVEIDDPRLARIVRQCSELPGQRLFQAVDEAGGTRRIGSGDVNEAIRAWMGGAFTAKDFRTWVGSVTFANAVKMGAGSTLKEMLHHVSVALGNTPAICRKHYIHPALIEAFLSGQLARQLRKPSTRPRGLNVTERAVLRFLELTGPVTLVPSSRSKSRREKVAGRR